MRLVFGVLVALILANCSSDRTSDDERSRDSTKNGPDQNQGSEDSQSSDAQATSDQQDADKAESPQEPGGVASFYFRCEIKFSNDKKDFPDMSVEDFEGFEFDKEPVQGDLCYWTKGRDYELLVQQCEHAVNKVRLFEDFGNVYKAYPKKVGAEDYCEKDNFTDENSSCACDFEQNGMPFFVVGKADFCETGFDVCQTMSLSL